MEWLGGMSTRSRQELTDHEKRVDEAIVKAKLKEEAKRAAKVATKAAKAAAKAEKGAAKAAAKAAIPTNGRRRGFRRVLKRNDSLSLRAENPEAVISRRGSVQHIRSESPPTSTKRSPLRNSFLDVSGHRLRLGASNEMRSRSNAESSPPLATASLDCTVDTAGSYPTTKYSAFWPPSLQRRLDGTHVRGESLTIPLGSTSTTTNGGASDSCPSLAEVLSNNSEPPFDLKSFLRFAKRQWMDESILFYLEVNAFKAAGGGEAEYLTYVKRIYHLYIMPTGPREVNISGGVHIATSAAVSAVLNGQVVNIPPALLVVADQEKIVKGETRSSRHVRGSRGVEIAQAGWAVQAELSKDPSSDSGDQNPPSFHKLGKVVRNSSERVSPPTLNSLGAGSTPSVPNPPSAASHSSCGNEEGEDDEEISLKDALKIGLRLTGGGVEHTVGVGEGEEEEDGDDERYNDERCRSSSHVPEAWLDTSSTVSAADENQDEWNTMTVAGLFLVGPGGGFGDRSIFDMAQRQIYDLLDRDAYPRFAASCLSQTLDRAGKIQSSV